MGVYVNLKIVTEIRWSSASATFILIAECLYMYTIYKTKLANGTDWRFSSYLSIHEPLIKVKTTPLLSLTACPPELGLLGLNSLIGSGGGGLCCGLGATSKTNKWLKGLKLFTGSWVHGHGSVGVGCRLWRLPPSWFRNDWSEVAASSVLWCGERS